MVASFGVLLALFGAMGTKSSESELQTFEFELATGAGSQRWLSGMPRKYGGSCGMLK